MLIANRIVLAGILISSAFAFGKNNDHEWKTGKVLDENRARYFAGMLNNSSSRTNEDGTWNGNANSTTIGDSANTQLNGTYSGTSNTYGSGSSVAIYRAYDNLVIEGDDTVFVTSERLRWRWSRGAHVAVNGEIKYYVDGRKLHVLDEDNKEHTIEILKEIIKPVNPVTAPPVQPASSQATIALQAPVQTSLVPLEIESTPPDADIEIDGAFVGNTPSTITVLPGAHEIAIRKKGFATWTRKMNITGGSVHLNAELEASPTAQ